MTNVCDSTKVNIADVKVMSLSFCSNSAIALNQIRSQLVSKFLNVSDVKMRYVLPTGNKIGVTLTLSVNVTVS